MGKKYWHIFLSLFLLGGALTASQILILREVLILSQGNELTIGLVLCVYLIYFAAGSYLASTAFHRFFKNDKNLMVLFVATAFMPPLVIYSFASIRSILGLLPTELIPVTNLSFFLLFVLCPCCLCFGACFPLMAAKLERISGKQSAVSLAYIVESFGSGSISLFVLFYVFQNTQPLNAAFFISLLILIATGILFGTSGEKKIPFQRVFLFLLLILLFGGGLFSQNPHQYLKEKQWGDLDYVSGMSSKYGYLEAVKVGRQVNVYQNGVLAITPQDNHGAKTILSIARLQGGPSESILCLGGGANGFLDALAEETFKRCDYVEMNDSLIPFAKQNGFLSQFNQKETNVFIHNQDDRAFLARTPHRYDLVIANKAAPNTLQNNRFYTKEYYQMVNKVLSPKGIFLFEVPSSGNYLPNDQRVFLASLYRTLKEVFPSIVMIPGEKCLFLLSKDPSFHLQEGQPKNKDEETYFRLLFRKNQVINRWQLKRLVMDVSDSVKINQDSYPVAYIYNILKGEEKAKTPFLNSLKALSQKSKRTVFLGFLFLALINFWVLLHNQKIALPVMAFFLGLTNISMQIMVLLLFQIRYGFLYFQIGVLTAMFMLGISFGSAIALAVETFFKQKRSAVLLSVCFLVTICPLFLTQILTGAYSSIIIFNLYSFTLGAFAGVAFPLLVYLKRKDEKAHHHPVGKIYAYDLIGASLGLLIVGPVLIGLLGVTTVCLMLFTLNVLNFAGFLMLRVSS